MSKKKDNLPPGGRPVRLLGDTIICDCAGCREMGFKVELDYDNLDKDAKATVDRLREAAGKAPLPTVEDCECDGCRAGRGLHPLRGPYQAQTASKDLYEKFFGNEAAKMMNEAVDRIFKGASDETPAQIARRMTEQTAASIGVNPDLVKVTLDAKDGTLTPAPVSVTFPPEVFAHVVKTLLQADGESPEDEAKSIEAMTLMGAAARQQAMVFKNPFKPNPPYPTGGGTGGQSATNPLDRNAQVGSEAQLKLARIETRSRRAHEIANSKLTAIQPTLARMKALGMGVPDTSWLVEIVSLLIPET